MAKLIDLTMPIKTHWRWRVEINKFHGFEKGDQIQSSSIMIEAHAFTHIDSPLHFLKSGKAIDDIPLDQLVGEAAVIDVSYKAANEAITSEDLEQHGRHVKAGDIVLIKTGWDTKCSWESRSFWMEAPYLTRDAAEWLLKRRVKAVGYDFPQDYVIRELTFRMPRAEEFVTHELLLKKGVLNIEYLVCLKEIKKDRVKLFALPLKLVGVEGAPARVIAIED